MTTIIAAPPAADGALTAYEALADGYDVLTAGYPYESWLGQIEAISRDMGVRGRRMFDVACGTGRSFAPLLDRGWEVVACDLSPAMAARAHERAAGRADVFVADMRALERFGGFDLVTCLDDALNYLLTEDDLRAALAGLRRNLAPGGVAVWDVSTLRMYRTLFAMEATQEGGDVQVAWRGRGSSDFAHGGIAEAVVDVVVSGEEGGSRCSTGLHRQRHWPLEDVARIAGEAGLEIARVFGQHRGALLERDADEAIHFKALFVARAADEEGGGA